MESACSASPGQQQQEEEKSGNMACSEECCSESCCDDCHHGDSADDSTDQLPTTFTRLRDLPRNPAPTAVCQDYLPPESLPGSPALSAPGPDTDNLTMVIEDLHMRQARLKKQRRCAFCRIHGLWVNVKGHKSYCQFRDKCMCTGCTLIRCTQRVSKNQVRLRRMKDIEADQEGLGPCTLEQQPLESAKKSPMCFKCWVHDSVRIRLKGHRTLCPYTRCACSNCALNADRKWLTRQLRQLTTPPKKRAEEEGLGTAGNTVMGNVTAAFYCPSVTSSQGPLPTSAYHLNTNMSKSNATALPSECYKNSADVGLLPFRLHRRDNWHVNTGLSPFSGIKQNVLGGFPPSLAQTGGALSQEAGGCLLPFATTTTATATTPTKWLPGFGSQLTHPPPFTPVTPNLSDNSDLFTITSSLYDSVGGVAASPGRVCQGGSECRWHPQPPPPPPSYITSDAGLLVMPSSPAGFPQSPPAQSSHGSSQHFQHPLQMGAKPNYFLNYHSV